MLVDIPKDVQSNLVEFSYPDKIELRSYKPTYSGHPLQIKKACDAHRKSRAPGLIRRRRRDRGRRLSEEVKAAGRDDHGAGDDDAHGQGGVPRGPSALAGHAGHARHAVRELRDHRLATCIIAIGARFDDRVTGKIDSFAPNAKVIHIDVDPAELGKNVRVDVPIVGDAKIILKKIITTLKVKLPKTAEWNQKIEAWKKEYPLDYDQECSDLKPQCVIQAINDRWSRTASSSPRSASTRCGRRTTFRC